MDPKQFRELVIGPTLLAIQLHTQAAENLLLGTALVESGLRHLRQLGGGPARGLYQMEPATHDDHWRNFLIGRDELRVNIEGLMFAAMPALEQLVINLGYATAMCRIHYLRVWRQLPEADDVRALAAYWKQWYNTPAGKGNESRFVELYLAHAS
ncbi:MAG: hypothetical protein A2V88_00735 [Elusimicrobia bacterium RBG_16_66_12]|nr:MAG: hypothetical protein A2V88_00735 [Elusimicrobia bacterium RBG_16_66_12]